MANSKEKKTNVQMFNEIYEYLSERDVPNEWLEFIDSRIELLTKQAEKSKERKAAKAAEKPADEMLAAVQAELRRFLFWPLRGARISHHRNCRRPWS